MKKYLKFPLLKAGFAGIELILLVTMAVGIFAAARLVQQPQNPQKQAATTKGQWIGDITGNVCKTGDSGITLVESYADKDCTLTERLGYTRGEDCDLTGKGLCYRLWGGKIVTRNSRKQILPSMGLCYNSSTAPGLQPDNETKTVYAKYEPCDWKENPPPADKCTGNCVADANLCGEGYKYNSKGKADCASRDSALTYCCEKTSSPPPTTNTTCSSIGYCSYENDLCNPGYIGVGKKDCDQFFYCCANLTPTPDPSQGKWIDDLGSACTSTNSSPYYTQFYPDINYCYVDHIVEVGNIPCAAENTGKCFKARGPMTTFTKKSFKSTSTGNVCKNIQLADQKSITGNTILDECEWSGTGGTGGGGPGGGPPGGGPGGDGGGGGGGTGGKCSSESSSKCNAHKIGDSCGAQGTCSNPTNKSGSDGKPLCKCKNDKPGADIGGNTKGYHDGDSGASGRCAVFGWTCDPDKVDQPVTVRIRQGPNVLAEVAADKPAEDAVKNICGGTADHRFEYIAPADSPLRDGQPHTITVEAKNIDDLGNFVNEYVELGNTPYQMTCDAAAPPVCDRCSYNYDYCRAQWPDVGGCGLPAPGTTVDYTLDFTCPAATPAPGITDTTCPDKNGLETCSRCSSVYKYLYADFASNNGCITSVDDTEINKKYSVKCSCLDGQETVDYSRYPYINKNEYDACSQEPTITPTPSDLTPTPSDLTPTPSDLTPTPTGPTPSPTPSEDWYAPDGQLCDGINYLSLHSDSLCQVPVGYITDSEEINGGEENKCVSGKPCYKAGGVTIDPGEEAKFQSRSDIPDNCDALEPGNLPPGTVYDQLLNCSYREAPKGSIQVKVKVSWENEDGEEDKAKVSEESPFKFLRIYVQDTSPEPDNFLTFFDKTEGFQNGGTFEHTFTPLFNDITYKVYVTAYDDENQPIDYQGIYNQGSCESVACEKRPDDEPLTFELRFPDSLKAASAQELNFLFETIINKWINNQVSSLDISRFIRRLTQVPGLQKNTCDPKVPGGCTFNEKSN